MTPNLGGKNPKKKPNPKFFPPSLFHPILPRGGPQKGGGGGGGRGAQKHRPNCPRGHPSVLHPQPPFPPWPGPPPGEGDFPPSPPFFWGWARKRGFGARGPRGHGGRKGPRVGRIPPPKNPPWVFFLWMFLKDFCFFFPFWFFPLPLYWIGWEIWVPRGNPGKGVNPWVFLGLLFFFHAQKNRVKFFITFKKKIIINFKKPPF